MNKIDSQYNEKYYVTFIILASIFVTFLYLVEGVRLCVKANNLNKSTVVTTTYVSEATTVATETSATTTTTTPTTSTVVTTTTTKPEPEPVRYFDVPLSEDLQDHIFELCKSYNVDPALVISMIRRESTYRASVIGDNGRSYGLMQIQPRWNQARMDALGCPDLLDPYQNVTVGIDIIAEYLETGKSVEWALMAYNGGPSYANNKASRGEISDYAKNVLAFAEELKRGVNG